MNIGNCSRFRMTSGKTSSVYNTEMESRGYLTMDVGLECPNPECEEDLELEEDGSFPRYCCWCALEISCINCKPSRLRKKGSIGLAMCCPKCRYIYDQGSMLVPITPNKPILDSSQRQSVHQTITTNSQDYDWDLSLDLCSILAGSIETDSDNIGNEPSQSCILNSPTGSVDQLLFPLRHSVSYSDEEQSDDLSYGVPYCPDELDDSHVRTNLRPSCIESYDDSNSGASRSSSSKQSRDPSCGDFSSGYNTEGTGLATSGVTSRGQLTSGYNTDSLGPRSILRNGKICMQQQSDTERTKVSDTAVMFGCMNRMRSFSDANDGSEGSIDSSSTDSSNFERDHHRLPVSTPRPDRGGSRHVADPKIIISIVILIYFAMLSFIKEMEQHYNTFNFQPLDLQTETSNNNNTSHQMRSSAEISRMANELSAYCQGKLKNESVEVINQIPKWDFHLGDMDLLDDSYSSQTDDEEDLSADRQCQRLMQPVWLRTLINGSCRPEVVEEEQGNAAELDSEDTLPNQIHSGESVGFDSFTSNRTMTSHQTRNRAETVRDDYSSTDRSATSAETRNGALSVDDGSSDHSHTIMSTELTRDGAVTVDDGSSQQSSTTRSAMTRFGAESAQDDVSTLGSADSGETLERFEFVEDDDHDPEEFWYWYY